jgi:hypothetical protein
LTNNRFHNSKPLDFGCTASSEAVPSGRGGRPMSSAALLLACNGYRCDATRAAIGFAPAINTNDSSYGDAILVAIGLGRADANTQWNEAADWARPDTRKAELYDSSGPCLTARGPFPGNRVDLDAVDSPRRGVDVERGCAVR